MTSRGGTGPITEAAPAQELPRPGFVSLPSGSETTVIAFSGHQRQTSSYLAFVRKLVEPSGSNAICLFDWNDVYYLGGTPGLGASFAAAAATLRRMAAELGSRRLICTGLSSGGYAALRYGLDLEADGVLAFSPVVLPVLEGTRMKHIAEALGVQPERRDIDLRHLYRERSPAPPARIVYGAANPNDVESAEYLAGLPQVTLQALAGVDDHNSLRAVLQSNEMPALFKGFLDETPGRWGAGRVAEQR